MQWVFGLYLVNTFFMLIIAIREVRKPVKALNWLTISLVLPVIGFILYLSAYRSVGRPRRKLTSPHNETDRLPESFGRSARGIAHSLRKLSVNGLSTAQVKPLINGKETYSDLYTAIKKAEQSIDLEYFIFRADEIGKRMIELLIERANAGVRVRFIRDGWGSRKLSRSQLKRMSQAGIQCRTMFPLRFPFVLFTWNYRDHCKNVVIDRRIAYTGGINIGYEYIGMKANIGFWRDTHVRLDGAAAIHLLAVFEEHWDIASPEAASETSAISSPHNQIESQIPALLATAEWGTELGTDAPPAYVHIINGDPFLPTQVIRETFFACLVQAEHTIDITTPYFLPDADIIMALKTAAAHGVRVRLLIPYKSDQALVDMASRTYFGELLEAGIEIYRYKKGMLHAKTMVVDGEIVEIGAANYDIRSFRMEYNVCVVAYCKEVAKQLTEHYEADLLDSERWKMDDALQRTTADRIAEQAARLFAPFL